jgi:phosphopantetheinyl transferase
LVRREPDGGAVFRRTLALDEEMFLADHTLGGRVSEDASVKALAIFPLAMSLETMAEAAAALAPGRRPLGLRSVRAHRWLAFERPRVEIEIVVQPREGDEVEVRVYEVQPGGPEGAPEGAPRLTVEGTVRLAADYPAAPSAGPADLREARAPRFRPEELYAEGMIHGMFHGPSLQGVASIERVGEDGALGTLQALPAGGLFRGCPDPAFLLDPLLIDAASQIIGYWTAHVLDRAFVVFPVGFERLDLYAPALRAPATARALARCRFDGSDRIVADLEAASADGRLLFALRGWEVKRIDLPERLYAFRLAPRDVVLSTPLPAPGALGEAVQCCRLEIPESFLTADGMIWREGLAHTVLSAAERETWRSLRSDRRRTEWLLGRLAAKDAVRLLMLARRGLKLFPADIEVATDPYGRPVVGGRFGERYGPAPILSLSHSGGVAMAVAAESGRGAGVGIDIEHLGRKRRDFDQAAFTQGERDLLGGASPEGRDLWSLNLWCAKEAVAKALGRGLMGNPKNLEAREIDFGRGMVRLGLAGALAREFPALASSPLTAWTGREGDLIVAAALCGEER